MKKSEVMKLKPGTVIELLWDEGKSKKTLSTNALLLEKPKNRKGDVSLNCLHLDNMTVDDRAVHSQVVRVVMDNKDAIEYLRKADVIRK